MEEARRPEFLASPCIRSVCGLAGDDEIVRGDMSGGASREDTTSGACSCARQT